MNDFQFQLGPLIKAVNTLFERDVDNQLSMPAGVPKLTGTQLRVLGYLMGHQHEIIYQRDLDKVFHTSRPTINGVIKRLRENGFVTVLPSPEDKRYKQIKLSPETREKMQAHRQEFVIVFSQIEQKMTRGMTTDEVDQLKILLKICLKNLQD